MKRLVETGEERIGKIAQQLLSNEKFVTAIQGLVSRSLSAKGTLDAALKTALGAMNLPSTEDVEALRGKLEDVEHLLASIEGKVELLMDKRAEKGAKE